MAASAAGPSWSNSLSMMSSGMAWTSNNLVQPGMTWMSPGLGPPSVTTPAPTPTASATISEPARKPRVFNIHQRLRELYMEECRNGRVSGLIRKWREFSVDFLLAEFKFTCSSEKPKERFKTAGEACGTRKPQHAYR